VTSRPAPLPYVDPMEYVEIARAESDRGTLLLRERRGDGPTVLELRANGLFVMDSAEYASERAMAEAALAEVADPRRVLVGGLGLGFTLDRVLADRRVERCEVVEIEQHLVDWMRDGTVPHGSQMLADRRAHVVVGDIAYVIEEAHPASYDVLLLDVDNGPGNLVHQHNRELYRPPFLGRVREVLAPGGALVIWSADRSEELTQALREVFGNAEEKAVAVTLQDRDEHYWLHIARVPPPAG
jgi:spermidine synthase